jgi:hypothetical protein
MVIKRSQSDRTTSGPFFIGRLYGLLAPRAYSVIIFGALFCTLAVKFFHSYRMNLLDEYFELILADISVLLGIEVILAIICFYWPGRWVIRAAVVVAAVVCTWSVMNAGWLIRTGTQILPSVLLSLFRDPINTLGIVGVNLAKMPVAAVILLGPSAVALIFFFFVLVKPMPPAYNRRLFVNRVFISVIIVIVTALAFGAVGRDGSAPMASAGLRYNCQVTAVASFLLDDWGRLAKDDLSNAKRTIPYFDQLKIDPPSKPGSINPVRSNPGKPGPLPSVQISNGVNHNIVVVVLEGVQYRHTSLAETKSERRFAADCKVGPSGDLTPYLATLARQGVEFVNARSSLTHTTKVLFALFTGWFPSASQDLAEAVPSVKPYASIATILKQQLNFRTAFFQSAKGNFECRPGLVYNLGFDKFWARDDLPEPDGFLGYLACDEFLMLEPIAEWIKADERPFFLTVLCSVTHDPYEVPEWFATLAEEPVQRYQQGISYTDKFLAALDEQLAKLNLRDRTIFCVLADHGEAFGEHGLLGHERIAFEEVLRVPWVMRAPGLIEPASKVTEPVSSVDLTPTLLGLLGFETEAADFDGVNALGTIPDGRKVYFSGWMQESPAGFVEGNRKFIYNPMDKRVSVYDLSTDPFELVRIELPQQQVREIGNEVIAWRRSTIFRLDQQRTGKKTLFDSWLCRWSNRVCSSKYLDKEHKSITAAERK